MSASQQKRTQQLPQRHLQQHLATAWAHPHARGDLLLALISNSLAQQPAKPFAWWQPGQRLAAGPTTQQHAAHASTAPPTGDAASCASWSLHSPPVPEALSRSSTGMGSSIKAGQALLQAALETSASQPWAKPPLNCIATLSLTFPDTGDPNASSSSSRSGASPLGASSTQQQQQQYRGFQYPWQQQPQQQQLSATDPGTLQPSTNSSSSSSSLRDRPLQPAPSFASTSATARSSSSSSSSAGGQQAAGPPGFRGLDVGKVLGLAVAQLLGHWPALQRGLQGGQQEDGEAGRTQGPPWQLRLPWQRSDRGPNSSGSSSSSGPGSSSVSSPAQTAAWQAAQAAQRWVQKGIVAERALDLRGALHCYTNAVALEPTNLEYVCRLAKQWSDLTYEEGVTEAHIVEVNKKAVEWADRAVQMAPKSPDGYLASCVSRGRLALISDNKTKVRLAKEAQEAARTALALDPSDDLAHHLMGRWHYEMAQINFVVRHLIKLVYGAALAPGTYQEALEEFKKASELNPTKLIHRVELGRSYLRAGRKQEALRELRLSMVLDVEDINAHLQKEDAAELLGKLQREFGKAVTWGGLSGAEGGAPGATPAAAAAGGGAPDGASVAAATGAGAPDGLLAAAATGPRSSSNSSNRPKEQQQQ